MFLTRLKISNRVTSREDFPFTVFECESYLSEEEFSRVANEFPWQMILQSSDNEDYRFRIDEYGHRDLYREVLRTRPHLATFLRLVHSHFFIRDLLSTFKAPIVARFPPSARLKRLGLRLAPTWLFDLKVDLTVYVRGFHLTPHTDGVEKVVAILMYFEDPSGDTRDSTTHHAMGGTRFWRAKSKEREEAWRDRLTADRPLSQSKENVLSLALERRFDSSDSLSDQLSEFQRDFEQYRLGEARNNHLAGFVKSNNSWHSVDLTEYPENLLRGAIFINLNLPPVSLRRCAHNFLKQYGLQRFLDFRARRRKSIP